VAEGADEQEVDDDEGGDEGRGVAVEEDFVAARVNTDFLRTLWRPDPITSRRKLSDASRLVRPFYKKVPDIFRIFITRSSTRLVTRCENQKVLQRHLSGPIDVHTKFFEFSSNISRNIKRFFI
jgi:hypothetical protein